MPDLRLVPILLLLLAAPARAAALPTPTITTAIVLDGGNLKFNARLDVTGELTWRLEATDVLTKKKLAAEAYCMIVDGGPKYSCSVRPGGPSWNAATAKLYLGLKPNTRYAFRLQATKGGKSSGLSSAVQWKTPGLASPTPKVVASVHREGYLQLNVSKPSSYGGVDGKVNPINAECFFFRADKKHTPNPGSSAWWQDVFIKADWLVEGSQTNQAWGPGTETWPLRVLFDYPAGIPKPKKGVNYQIWTFIYNGIGYSEPYVIKKWKF